MLKSRTSDSDINTISLAVFQSINFTSKRLNVCELTNNTYPEDTLMVEKLRGVEQISDHHCYGCIQYHPDNYILFKEANMYFECYMNLIQKHSWTGLEIKIQRSNGDIMTTNIHDNSCIIYFKEQVWFFIEFKKNDQIYNKCIPLSDYLSESRGITDKGIITLNPHFKEKELILYIDKHPGWLNTQRNKWKDIFETVFKKSGIKFKFEYN